ncbi:Endonuclease/exonuclease/phosphatase [Halteromyces radiatus]|uniref:Endonuclease/exonuclease/phosphatase n=1 Tax=Halteromyces radiatus TaxID=101107 RepID=UPI00221F6F4A|nr:Endonuclease/exonuclease/phosphatase [Halteromyces radiatus]KAI8084687.1 Endonuclease/exonuclease/phosphatase [Halteromyces radiatus]
MSIQNSNNSARSPDNTILFPQQSPDTHNSSGDETQQLLTNDQQGYYDESATPSMSRSFSAESVVSTQSAPPPYELYAPARTVVGRMFNWLRKIPRFATHQAIYLPTLPIRRRHHHHNNSHLEYNHHRQTLQQQQQQRPSTDSLSSTSIDSFASSAYPTTWCTPYYYQLCSLLPSCPRYVLPQPFARYRGLLLFFSVMALQLCCFLLFCAIYFAPADLPPPIFPDKILSDTHHARVLTLNIFMRPPGIKNNWSDYKDERLAYIIQHILPHYDIIAFQESFAFATRRKDELIKQARLRYGFNHHIESPRKYPWDISVDGGLLILSKFRITRSNIIQYPRGTHSDWLSRKGALHALIELNPSRRFHMYTTHTQASYDLNNIINAGDTLIRLEQFAQLHEFISNTARTDQGGDADEAPILILGDLNVDAAVHLPGVPLTEHSVDSSIHYTMMTDVLKGNGVDRKTLGLTDDDNQNKLFTHPYVLNDLTDTIYQHYGYHPVTFGDIDVESTDGSKHIVPGEVILTNHDQLMTVQSIDRIYWSARNSSSVVIQDPLVEPFKVKDNQDLTDQERNSISFTQISDHYGMSCSIRIID